MLGSLPPANAKQLYHLNLNGGKCELAAPDLKLDRYIDYYWLLTIEQPSLVLEVIPDTTIDLVLSPDIQDFAALYFPVDNKFEIDLTGPVRYAGTCFRAATTPEFLRQEFATLTALEIGKDTSKNLSLTPLMTDIQGVATVDSIVERFDRFWLAQLEQIARQKTAKSRISHLEMLNAIESTVGSGSIAGMCENLGVSERQFRRLSKDLFGLSPKKLQNVLRLQAALDELFHCHASQIHDFYYDDSHRIRELKRLTGYTPSQIRAMAEKYNTS